MVPSSNIRATLRFNRGCLNNTYFYTQSRINYKQLCSVHATYLYLKIHTYFSSYNQHVTRSIAIKLDGATPIQHLGTYNFTGMSLFTGCGCH